MTVIAHLLSLSPCAVLSLPVLDLPGLASGSRGATSPSAERQYHAAGRRPDNNKTYFSHIQHLHSLCESSLCNAGTKTFSPLTPRVCLKVPLCPKNYTCKGFSCLFSSKLHFRQKEAEASHAIAGSAPTFTSFVTDKCIKKFNTTILCSF